MSRRKRKNLIEIDHRLLEQFRDRESELEEYKEAFMFFDPFGKGFITKKSFDMILKSTGKMISDSDIELIYKDVGLHKNKIDFNTLLALMTHNTVTKPDNPQDISSSFLALRDENDEIPVKKFKHVMTKLLNKLDEGEVDLVLQNLPIETKMKKVRIEDSEFVDEEVEVISDMQKLFDVMVTKKY